MSIRSGLRSAGFALFLAGACGLLAAILGSALTGFVVAIGVGLGLSLLSYLPLTATLLSAVRIPLPGRFNGFHAGQRINVLMGLQETPARLVRFVGPPGRPQALVTFASGDEIIVPLDAVSRR